MKDTDKTKGQLLSELAEMRDRVARLEQNRAINHCGEARNQEHLERLELVFNATNDGIWDWDVKTGKSYYSPRYYTMLGYEPYEFAPTYENFRRLIHPDDLTATEDVIGFSLENHTSYAVEFRMKFKTGGWRWILSRGRATEVDSDGQFVRMVGSHTDITIRKRAEESLRLTQFIFNNAPIGIFKIGTDGRILDVNEKGVENLGYHRDELVGTPLFDIVDGLSLKDWEKGLAILKEHGSRTIETFNRQKSGKLFPVQVIEKLVVFGDSEIHVGFVQDISERKKLETEREQLINDLQQALAEIKELRGYIPICASCKKIRDDHGYWQQVEKYIMDRTDAQFSHGYCPQCYQRELQQIEKS